MQSNPLWPSKNFRGTLPEFCLLPRRLLSRELAVVRLFIIYDLVDSLGDRSLDVLEEHIKRITLPEDNNFIPKSRAIRVQANLASQESEDARPSGPRLPGGLLGSATCLEARDS